MKHIIALSGGKDSTALALRLAETEQRDYMYMCTPTGDELPEMEQHWQKLENILDAPIIRVTHPKWKNFNHMIQLKKCLPNFRMRFCTGYLKIETAQAFYAENEPCIAYVGLRADEPKRTGIIDLESVRYPLQEWGWGINQVWNYLKYKKINIPDRTDCARCFFQRLDEWWILWKKYPEIYADAESQEKEFNKTFLSPGKWGGRWPHDLRGMRKEFEKGKTPKRIDLTLPLFPEFGEHDQKCRECTL